jgi:Tfp pilus assembly protein PilN
LAVAAETSAPETGVPLRRASRNAGWRRWLSFGAGVGIEVAGRDLRVLVVRVRPAGVVVAGEMRIEGFDERPAAEWGAEYAAFLKTAGATNVPAALLIPRSQVTVRHLALPGVAPKDLPAAISFQVDSLHPYDENEAVHCWARLDGGQDVLVGVTTSAVLNGVTARCAEAGIKLGWVTFSAAALYTGARLYRTPPEGGFLAMVPDGAWAEAYGESAARPVFSSPIDVSSERARAMAASDLRLEPGAEPVWVDQILPPPVKASAEFDLRRSALVYSAALMSATGWWALPANFLPESHRSSAPLLAWAPTAVLLVLTAIAGGMLAGQDSMQSQQYLDRLNAEIARFERRVRRVEQLDADAAAARARAELIQRFRRRSQADADALRELTAILPPPVWLNNLVLTRSMVTLYGEADNAAELLKTLDSSALFAESEFAQMTGRNNEGVEPFVIRAKREGPGTGEEKR